MLQTVNVPLIKHEMMRRTSSHYIFDDLFISVSNAAQAERIRATKQYLKGKDVIIPAERKGSDYAIQVHDLLDICVIAKRLADRYDVGVGLAFGGVGPAFVFERYGLDVKLVDVKRKGAGASVEADRPTRQRSHSGGNGY